MLCSTSSESTDWDISFGFNFLLSLPVWLAKIKIMFTIIISNKHALTKLSLWEKSHSKHMDKAEYPGRKKTKTKTEWHYMDGFLVGIISVKQEHWGNELSVLHWGANHYRQHSYLQRYYFLHRTDGNKCLRKVPSVTSRIGLGLKQEPQSSH